MDEYTPILIDGSIGFTWSEVRVSRDEALKSTDLWYLKDRWDNLTTTAKGQLNTYRQLLRDLPQTYSDPDEAVENWPIREEWF